MSLSLITLIFSAKASTYLDLRSSASSGVASVEDRPDRTPAIDQSTQD